MLKTAGCLLIIMGSLFSAGSVRGQAASQTTPVRDPQALSVLGQCIRAGGDQAIGTVRDFSATGKITYAGTHGDTAGEVSIKGKGTDEYSLMAQLPEGNRSWATTHMKGYSQDIHGKKQAIPAHNSVNMGALNFPFLSLYEVYNSPAASVRFVGKTTRYGHAVFQIRTQRNFQEKEGNSGTLSKLSIRDFFIDTESLLPVGVVWTSHPVSDFNQELSEELIYSNFAVIDGVKVPLNVTDYLAGQKRWTMELEQVKMNTGVTDLAFEE